MQCFISIHLFISSSSFLICADSLQPYHFEQCVVQMLQSFKEPLETKQGEINVRYLPTNPLSFIRAADCYYWSVFLFYSQRKMVHLCFALTILLHFCPTRLNAVAILLQVLQLDQVQDQAAELIVTIMTVIWHSEPTFNWFYLRKIFSPDICLRCVFCFLCQCDNSCTFIEF